MSVEKIASGYFLLHRKKFCSEAWRKEPMYDRAFEWIVGNANHETVEKNGFIYRRGEVVTTYKKMCDALAYYVNRKKIVPSIKKIRTILDWLKSRDMIYIKPLISERCRTRADSTADTGAHLGIKIIVVNYDTYQVNNDNKGRHQGRHKGNNNNNNIYSRVDTRPPESPKKQNNQPVKEIIADLNEKAGSSYQPTTKKTISLINARLKEGFTLDDFIAVNACKSNQWKNNKEMSRYLRPQTLYAGNFEAYLQEARKETKKPERIFHVVT